MPPRPVHRLRRLCVLAFIAAPTTLGAQSIPKALVGDIKYGVLDMFSVWTSPFRGDRGDYATAGLMAAGFGLSLLADEPVGDWVRTHQHVGVLHPFAGFRDGNRLKLGIIGSAPRVAKAGLAVYLVGLFAGKSGLRDAGMGCLASLEAESIPRRLIIYKQVGRDRPEVVEISGVDTVERAGDPHRVTFPGTDSWWDNSFYGGHAANVMSCVSFWNHRFDLGYVEPVLWLAGSSVALARMADQRHWTSDTYLGVVMGTVVGRYVAKRSEARRANRDGQVTEPDGMFFARQGSTMVVGWRARY